MTKEEILQRIDAMQAQLDELRAAVEQLPDGHDPLADLEREDEEWEEVSDEEKEAAFKLVREVLGIPPDYVPEMTLEEAREEMGKGMPENWGSREIMRMREE